MKIKKYSIKIVISILLMVIIICSIKNFKTIYNYIFPSSEEQYIFVTKWKNPYPTESKILEFPGIVVDSKGNIYVTRFYDKYIQKFNSKGEFITKWGNEGSKDEIFKCLTNIALDSKDNVYVNDGSIQKFDSNGKFLTKWAAILGTIAIDTKNNLYVKTRMSIDFVKVYNPDGKCVAQWGFPEELDETRRKFFPYPSFTDYIAIDKKGNFYITFWVSDYIVYKIPFTNRIVYSFGPGVVKYNLSGGYVTKWGRSGTGYGEFKGIDKYLAYTSLELRKGTFEKISGIATDLQGNVYVVDTGNHRIQKFTSNGKFLTKWGSFGSCDGLFNKPTGIAVDKEGNVYVVDNGNYRIQKFALKL